MPRDLSRRNFFHLTAGAGALIGPCAALLLGEQKLPPPPKGAPASALTPSDVAASPAVLDPVYVYPKKSTVALVRGEDRRKNITTALEAIDDQLRPILKKKKYVIIKPNNVSTVNQLAATHVDTLHGILDYLASRFKGPIVIAESSAGDTMTGFENFKYNQVVTEHKDQKPLLVDLNAEAKFITIPLLDPDLHVVPVRLAARLLDPEAFIISSAMLKTHNAVVATMSIKNIALGAPLHSAPKETPKWNDKRKYHGGVRQSHYNIMVTAQALRPYWGAAVIDGFEGMEGNGPASGTPVDSRVAIASTDFLAADRVGLEAMSINPTWPGYLMYCAQCGLGQYDLNQIEVRGYRIADVKKPYQLHKDIEQELLWRGPMTELPPKLG
jgi:uncharacterized protein (DUF362 family)